MEGNDIRLCEFARWEVGTSRSKQMYVALFTMLSAANPTVLTRTMKTGEAHDWLQLGCARRLPRWAGHWNYAVCDLASESWGTLMFRHGESDLDEAA